MPIADRRVIFHGEIGPDSPLWTKDGVGLDLSLFNLPAALKRRLTEWVRDGWDLDDRRYEDWLARGRSLCEETQPALPEIQVLWDDDI